MKGIVLAGGSGTRLYPITKAISKQLMPIYDKPMVYYPLSTLIEGGINEILIITTPHDQAAFKNLLGDGSELGCKFEYIAQKEPRGLADAFILGEEFLDGGPVAMILGDNIFHSDSIIEIIKQNHDPDGGLIFAAPVHDPQRYGIVEFDRDGNVLSVEEKPEKPKSNYAIPGLYIFDKNASAYAKEVKPSERGEIEITEVQDAYLKQGKLKAGVMSKDSVWLDTGTFDSMVAAAEYVRVIEHRQNNKIGCIEEAAYISGFIDKKQLLKLADPLMKSGYGSYLKKLV
jgi:glucose-1-phosphate thymidylyltransferase